ncbi:MAG: CTP synthase [Candidatus Hodarchaeales archaeon]
MDRANYKIIIVIGGVMSGIGKGAITASIGKLLQWRGLKVVPTKLDPYIQIDPGTLSPVEHGEVFVTEEVWDFNPGTSVMSILRIAELDQDFGTYERFLDQNTHPSQNITSGQIFLTVINNEREGKYLGKTVQMIPHITDEIKRRILSVKREDTDIILAEIGGTIGDIEGLLYLEAARQLRLELGPQNVVCVAATYIPYNEPVQELKTKPTQHSMARLLAAGIMPDFIVCRSNVPINDKVRKKISLFCNVSVDSVISNPDLDSVYDVPIIFEKQYFAELLLQKLDMIPKKDKDHLVTKTKEWKNKVAVLTSDTAPVLNIGILGKYTDICDSYISVNEALKHAGLTVDHKVEISWVDSEQYDDNKGLESLEEFDGILVPGGFGSRGTEGKIHCAQYCIKNNIPFLGICYGMQLGLVAFARLIGMVGANTTEVDPVTAYPVIDILENQRDLDRKGGTMRLGGYRAVLKPGTLVAELYSNAKYIVERHRHRYEVNPKFIKRLEEGGLVISGISPDETLVEFIELPPKVHPFWVGTQAHPEFKSRLNNPAPLYVGLIEASLIRTKGKI